MNTKKQYNVYIKRWEKFCVDKRLDLLSPTLENVLEFLGELFNEGLSYSAINTARSALSTFIRIDGKAIGTHPLIIRMLKGVFNLRPAIPKNNTVWDVEIVMNYLKNLGPCKLLNLKRLSQKLVALLLILTFQRGQSVHSIDIRNMYINDNKVTIKFGELLKTSRPGFQQHDITIKAYAPDRRLCLITVLKEYLKRTKLLRGSHTKLLLVTQKPYGPASKNTIVRWFKDVLRAAGIDLNIFTPHSSRAASTSAALQNKIPISSILKTAGWSGVHTFEKYYKKLIAK